MNFMIGTSIVDPDVSDHLRKLHPDLKEFCTAVSGEYGGDLNHLWVDLELVRTWRKPDGNPRHPFRFQKRVSGRSRHGLPSIPDWENVGHYSVCPDIELLVSLSPKKSINYILNLIYDSTEILYEKHKKLGEFDVSLFRSNYAASCKERGFKLTGKASW